MDAPCGFPIVTQMRSSSSVEMPIRYEVGRNDKGSDDGRSDEYRKSKVVEDKSRVESFHIPIRDSRLKTSSGQGQTEDSEDCFCLAAEEIHNGQNLAVIMTVRYYDEIRREMQIQSREIQDEARSVGQDLGGENDKISVRTTVTTVARLSIHISSPHKPFPPTNSNTGIKFHRIVLSATTFTDEVENCVGSNDSNLSVPMLDQKSEIDVMCHQTSYYNEYIFPEIQPQIIISSNGKHIACLIPRPIRLNSKENTAIAPSRGIPGSSFLSKVSTKKTSKISTVVILNLGPPTMEQISKDRDDSIVDPIGDIAARDGMDKLPLPQYLQTKEYNDEGGSHHEHGQENQSSLLEKVPDTHVLPITTNDRIVTMNPMSTTASKELSNLLLQITCIVDLNHNQVHEGSKYGIAQKGKNAPMLLAGCNDGSIVIIAYKRAMALGIVYQRHIPPTIMDSPPKSTIASEKEREMHDVGLRVLRYTIADPLTSSSGCFEGLATGEQSMNETICGKLLGIQHDGCVVMFDTQFQDGGCNFDYGEVDVDRRLSRTLSWESKTYSFRLTLKPNTKLHGTLRNMYANGCFIDSNTIAVLVKPLVFEHSGNSLQFHNVIAQVWSVDPRHSGVKLIARLLLDHDKLEGMQYGNFWLPGFQSFSVSPTTISSILPIQSHIEYNHSTGSLSVSSAIPLARSTRSNGVYARLFVSLWDWKTCTIGFSLMSDDKIYFTNRGASHHGREGVMSPTQFVTSRQYFSKINGIHALVHLYSKCMRYKRDIYHVGVLSPSRSRSYVRDGEASNPIFLTRDQVMYPGTLEVGTHFICHVSSSV
jgi:hypothetical protein